MLKVLCTLLVLLACSANAATVVTNQVISTVTSTQDGVLYRPTNFLSANDVATLTRVTNLVQAAVTNVLNLAVTNTATNVTLTGTFYEGGTNYLTPTNRQLVSVEYVSASLASVLNNGIILYGTTNSVVAGFTPATNIIFSENPPQLYKRTFTNLTAGAVFASAMTTNRYRRICGPIVNNYYVRYTAGGGQAAFTMHPELAITYDMTNLIPMVTFEQKEITPNLTRTNLYTWTQSLPQYFATNSDGFWVVRLSRCDSVAGNNPVLDVMGGDGFPTTMAFTIPGNNSGVYEGTFSGNMGGGTNLNWNGITNVPANLIAWSNITPNSVTNTYFYGSNIVGALAYNGDGEAYLYDLKIGTAYLWQSTNAYDAGIDYGYGIEGGVTALVFTASQTNALLVGFPGAQVTALVLPLGPIANATNTLLASMSNSFATGSLTADNITNRGYYSGYIDWLSITNLPTNVVAGSAYVTNGITSDGSNRIGGITLVDSNVVIDAGHVIKYAGADLVRAQADPQFNYYIGDSAGTLTNTGSGNIAIGYAALMSIVSGAQNTLVGYQAGQYESTGSANTGVGAFALKAHLSGGGNTALGFGTLQNTTGDYNTAVGTQAGQGATGSSNVFIGYKAGQSEARSNKLYIANSATTTPLIYGDFTTGRLYSNGTNDSNAVVLAVDLQQGTNAANAYALAIGLAGTNLATYASNSALVVATNLSQSASNAANAYALVLGGYSTNFTTQFVRTNPVYASNIIGTATALVYSGLTNVFVDCSADQTFTLLLTNNVFLIPTNCTGKFACYTLNTLQDAVGNRTVTWQTNQSVSYARFSGGIPYSATTNANAQDVWTMSPSYYRTNLNVVLTPNMQ